MSSMNVSSSIILKEIHLCDECSTTIKVLESFLENSKVEVEKLGWEDENFDRVADIVDDCILAFEKVEKKLERMRGSLDKMLEIIQEYERENNG